MRENVEIRNIQTHQVRNLALPFIIFTGVTAFIALSAIPGALFIYTNDSSQASLLADVHLLVKLGIVWSLSFLASFLSFLIVVTLDLFYVPRPQPKDD